jgi:molecular chaperone Hsp33
MSDKFAIDISIPFLLPSFSIRGRLVRLQGVNKTILKQHDYPYPVKKVMAELLAASATLAGLLKFEGVFTLQTKSNGPLSLSVIDVTHEGQMRGYAQFNPHKIQPHDGFASLMGHGHLAFTVDQGLKIDRYQGIVALNHTSLPEALEHYFEQSEQLETRFFIDSEQTAHGVWKSSALLLQQMPSQKVDAETWNYIEAVLQTLSTQEFLDFSTPYELLLRRLFHEGNITLYDPFALKAKCRCSEERIKSFLATLSPTEIESLLENGQLKLTCEFCNHTYVFDRKNIITIH